MKLVHHSQIVGESMVDTALVAKFIAMGAVEQERANPDIIVIWSEY